LAASITWVDAATPLRGRILAPIFGPRVVLVLGLADGSLSSLKSTRILGALLIVSGAAFVAHGLTRTVGWAIGRSRDGAGYSSSARQQSPTMQQLLRLPPGTLIYSNAPDAIYILTERRTAWLPRKFSTNTLQPNLVHHAEITAMQERVEREHGLTVYLENVSRSYLPSEGELTADLPPHLVSGTSDGSVYDLTSQRRD
jgi:hypothetical protein